MVVPLTCTGTVASNAYQTKGTKAWCLSVVSTHIFEIVGALRPRAVDDVRDALAAHQALLPRGVLAGDEQERLRHLNARPVRVWRRRGARDFG